MARDLNRRYPDVTSFVHALEGLMGIDLVAPAMRMQGLHSERIDLTPLTPRDRAALGSEVMGAETQTLELNRQRIRRTRIAVIAVGAAILVGIGIRVLTAPRSTGALKALEERSRMAETPAEPGAGVAQAAPTARALGTDPNAVASGALPERTIGGVPVVPPGGAAPVAGADPRLATGAGVAAGGGGAGKTRSHLRFTTSRTDRGEPAARVDQASERVGEPVRENVRPPPANQPYTPPTPATRAGRLTIDDF
jgi:hypothetical protein